MAVELRPLTLADAAALLELRVRNREFFAPHKPERDESFFTLAAQRTDIDASRQRAEADSAYSYGVFAGAELVGHLALGSVVRGPFQNAYLGYAIGRDHNRRGHATAAVRRITETAFGELALHRLQAAVVPSNKGSVRVLEKAGFREEGLARRYLFLAGEWRDHRLFAITSEEMDT